MRYEDYVNAFELGDAWGRADLAKRFGVSLSTARYHLERAVAVGLLHKQYGWLGRQSGWLYALPDTLPMFEWP